MSCSEIMVGEASHGLYKSMPRTSTAHAVGMLTMAANWMGQPDAEADD